MNSFFLAMQALIKGIILNTNKSIMKNRRRTIALQKAQK